jgi:uncharacterized protein (TIGR02466 family)
VGLVMDFVSLFPTAVGRKKLRDLTQAERDSFTSLGAEQVPNEGNTTSKARMVLHDYRLADLRSLILAELQAYADTIVAAASRPEVVITQSWLNCSKPGQWHHKHAHPGSWLSACYYVAAVPDSDRIYFHRDGYDRLQFDPHEQNQFNATSWWLPVASGDLVIFPSSLTHHVAPVQADTTRVSLAINTWFNGTAGSSDTLTELSCKVAAPFA